MMRISGLLVCAALATLVGCSAEPDETGTPAVSAGSGSATDQCGTLLSDRALTILGWAVDSTAELHAGRCERRAEGSGAVTVVTRAVAGTAREGLAAQCDELRSDGGYVDQPVVWLDPQSDASCFTNLADSRTGVAELYFVNAVDELVQIRVEALTPVGPEQLEDAISVLARTASDLSG